MLVEISWRSGVWGSLCEQLHNRFLGVELLVLGSLFFWDGWMDGWVEAQVTHTLSLNHTHTHEAVLKTQAPGVEG